MIGQRILIVSAHPDDEVLGCGGTISRFAADGAEVHSLFVADGVGSRDEGALTDGSLEKRREAAAGAAEIMGVRSTRFLDFADNRLDSVPMLDVVQAIEAHAAELQPDCVLTHFGGDLNVDHAVCARAVTTAFRPTPGSSVRLICAFEVASSTEWAFGETPFSPDVFVDISAHLDRKLAALDAYADEMRSFPHPRSRQGVAALAQWRGATAGVQAAEAFKILRSVV